MGWSSTGTPPTLEVRTRSTRQSCMSNIRVYLHSAIPLANSVSGAPLTLFLGKSVALGAPKWDLTTLGLTLVASLALRLSKHGLRWSPSWSASLVLQLAFPNTASFPELTSSRHLSCAHFILTPSFAVRVERRTCRRCCVSPVHAHTSIHLFVRVFSSWDRPYLMDSRVLHGGEV